MFVCGGEVSAVLLIVITSVDKTQQDMSQNHRQDIVLWLHSDLLADKLALILETLILACLHTNVVKSHE